MHDPGGTYGQHGYGGIGGRSSFFSFFSFFTGKVTNSTGLPSSVTTASEARKSPTCVSSTLKRISLPCTFPALSKDPTPFRESTTRWIASCDATCGGSSAFFFLQPSPPPQTPPMANSTPTGTNNNQFARPLPISLAPSRDPSSLHRPPAAGASLLRLMAPADPPWPPESPPLL